MPSAAGLLTARLVRAESAVFVGELKPVRFSAAIRARRYRDGSPEDFE